MKLSKSLQKLFVCSVALASIVGLGASASNLNANASHRHHHHVVRVIKRHHHKVHHYHKHGHKHINLNRVMKRGFKNKHTYTYNDSTTDKRSKELLTEVKEGIISPKQVNHALRNASNHSGTATTREVDLLEAEIQSGSEYHLPKSTLYQLKYSMTNNQANDIATCARANNKPYYAHIFSNLKKSGYQYKIPKHHEHHYERPANDDPSKGFHHNYNFGHDPFHSAHLDGNTIHHYTYGSRIKIGHHKGHFYVG